MSKAYEDLMDRLRNAKVQPYQAKRPSLIDTMPAPYRRLEENDRQASLANRSRFDAAQRAAEEQIAREEEIAAKAAEDRAMIERLTEGARADILQDPSLEAVRSFYGNVLSGKDVPYTDEVKQALINQLQLSRSTAQQREMSDLRRGAEMQGLSPDDPGYASAMRAADTRRLLGSAADINDATLEQALNNWAARSGAAGSLGSSRMGQLGAANQMGLAGAAYRAQRSYDVPNDPNVMAQQMASQIPLYPGYKPPDMPAIQSAAAQSVTDQRTGTRRASTLTEAEIPDFVNSIMDSIDWKAAAGQAPSNATSTQAMTMVQPTQPATNLTSQKSGVASVKKVGGASVKKGGTYL